MLYFLFFGFFFLFFFLVSFYLLLEKSVSPLLFASKRPYPRPRKEKKHTPRNLSSIPRTFYRILPVSLKKIRIRNLIGDFFYLIGDFFYLIGDFFYFIGDFLKFIGDFFKGYVFYRRLFYSLFLL